MIKLIASALVIFTFSGEGIADTLTLEKQINISVTVNKPVCTLQAYTGVVDFSENLKENLPVSRDIDFSFVNCVGVSSADVSFEGVNIDSSKGYITLTGEPKDGAASGVIIKLYRDDKLLNLNNTLNFDPFQNLNIKAKLETEDGVDIRHVVAGYVKSNVDFTIIYR